MKDDRLKIYVVSSHVDKPLKEEYRRSAYECPIQAGAALTEKRICRINDHDDFPESISDRNQRYSEGTAMWWIARHIDSPWVGIAHYRRRFDLSDEQLSQYMDAGVDVITSTLWKQKKSIEEDYKEVFYAADWDLFMYIIRENTPEDEGIAEKCFASKLIRPCNMNIFKSEIYIDFCEWAFPMLDEFWRRSPVKTDRYQRRDVGFILERLSHLFVEKMIDHGKYVIEANIDIQKSKNWAPEEEICDFNDPSAVFNVCDRLYKENWIDRCCQVLIRAKDEGVMDGRMKRLATVMAIGQAEQRRYPVTMHEYLPEELRSSLETLLQTYEGFRKAVCLYLKNRDDSARRLLKCYMELTHFSAIVINTIGRQEGATDADLEELSFTTYR